MFQLKHLPKIGVALSVPIVFAESKDQPKKDAKKTTQMIKPSKLPIYEEPKDFFDYEYHGKEKCKLKEGISVVRKEMESAYELTADARESVNHVYETGKAHTLGSIDFVLDDANIGAKVGAITVGGLLGLMIGGRRKGVFKKMLYGTTAAAGTAAFVYPKEVSKVYRDVYDNAGDYGAVAYNFVAGVKPQSEAKSAPSSEPPKKKPSPPTQPPSEKPAKTEPKPADKKSEEKCKDVVVKVEKDTSKCCDVPPPPSAVVGDMGQSHPDDKDLYTTRG